jgi:hypothetical protein
MCKKMLVIPVKRVVDKKRIIGKNRGRGQGESQGVLTPKKELELSGGFIHLSVFDPKAFHYTDH